MNQLLIYHSNYSTIEFPSICKSNFTKDFSYGFYCTTDKNQAEISANSFNSSIVNIYALTNPESLNIRKFNNYCDEWLDFLMSCRNGNIHTYDVIISPIADDTIYDYMDSYIQGQMNKEKFYKSMKSNYPTDIFVALKYLYSNVDFYEIDVSSKNNMSPKLEFTENKITF